MLENPAFLFILLKDELTKKTHEKETFVCTGYDHLVDFQVKIKKRLPEGSFFFWDKKRFNVTYHSQIGF